MHDYMWVYFLGMLITFGIPIGITYVIVRIVTIRTRDKWLLNQALLWQENKIITPEQTNAILIFSKSNKAVPKKKFDMVKIITLFGAVFIGIGIIFLIASNWQEIPAHVRTAALLILTIGTLWTGYFLSYEKGKYPVLGKSLIVLASILWGGTLALIAQIYNLSSDGSWVILILWSLPLLPIAFFLENEYVFILASVILGIWNVSYSVGRGLPNYYYPAIVFLGLFPLAKKFDRGAALNIVGLIIASFFAMGMKYLYIPFGIFTGFMVYYLINYIKIPLGKELFLFCASVALLTWNIGFNINTEFKDPNYLMVFPLLLVIFFCYKDKAKASLGINILSIMIFLNFIYAAVINVYKYHAGIIVSGSFEILLGVLIYLTGLLHEHKMEDKDYVRIYKIFGFMIIFGIVYFLSFNEIYEREKIESNILNIVSISMASLSLLFFAYIYMKNYLKAKEAKIEAIAILAVIFFTSIMLLATPGTTVIVYIANAVLIVISLVMLFYGMEVQSPKIFNSGIAALVLFIVTRYIDVFWKLKEKSVFFIISGIIFIAAGSYLEKKRKEIVRRMKNEK